MGGGEQASQNYCDVGMKEDGGNVEGMGGC
jgi:hypothetical protein